MHKIATWKDLVVLNMHKTFLTKNLASLPMTAIVIYITTIAVFGRLHLFYLWK